ncbi:MAG: O-acetylhomoserine aminocarboxypropyltransferase/cysteine synthase family protein, partial [Gammaproteobacteria bacterium]
VSSGMAASAIALMTLCEQGDHIVAARTLYGGTHSLLDFNFRRLGIESTLVDADDPQAYAAAITPRTKVIYAETIGNPVINVLDIEAVADVARDAGVPLMIDNTFPTPYLCRPFDFGADIVLHSATKFLGGHGTTIGGVIVESGRFPWDNGKFPGMTEPSEGYHGVRFYETFGDFGYTMRARLEQLRVMGPALSPFNGFLLLQGIETLPVRMDRHCDNALGVARFLAAHELVEWVRYPGLPDDPHHALAEKYMPRGAGGILSFGVRGGRAAGARFIESVQFLSHLANVGDAKSLVIHPASTTHRQMSEDAQLAAGITPDMVRLSVGLETLDDILWDLDQALARSQA